MEELSRMGTSDLQQQHPDKTGAGDMEHCLQRKMIHTEESSRPEMRQEFREGAGRGGAEGSFGD